ESDARQRRPVQSLPQTERAGKEEADSRAKTGAIGEHQEGSGRPGEGLLSAEDRMATRYPNRDYERRSRRDPHDYAEEREDMWVGVADRERRRRLDDRIRERGSERPLWPSLDRSGEPRVGDVMTGDVCTIHFSDSAENAARAMVRRDCGALPVVDDSGRLIGMVTDRDIVTRVIARGLD